MGSKIGTFSKNLSIECDNEFTCILANCFFNDKWGKDQDFSGKVRLAELDQ